MHQQAGGGTPPGKDCNLFSAPAAGPDFLQIFPWGWSQHWAVIFLSCSPQPAEQGSGSLKKEKWALLQMISTFANICCAWGSGRAICKCLVPGCPLCKCMGQFCSVKLNREELDSPLCAEIPSLEPHHGVAPYSHCPPTPFNSIVE